MRKVLPSYTSLFTLLLLLTFGSIESVAQSYDDIIKGDPEAVLTTITANAFVFDAPAQDGKPVGRFVEGTEVLAYKPQGFFFSVATEAQGFVGYVLVNKLDVEQDPDLVVISPIADADYREPGIAQSLSIAMPGGGQIYAGSKTKGIVLFAGSLVSFVGGYAVSLNDTKRICRNEDLQTGCRNEINKSGLIYGSAAAVSIWAYGILTAKGDAKKYNEANGLMNRAAIYPTLDQNGLGVAMRFTW